MLASIFYNPHKCFIIAIMLWLESPNICFHRIPDKSFSFKLKFMNIQIIHGIKINSLEYGMFYNS